MQFSIPYGKSSLTVNLPDGLGVDLIEPPRIPGAADPLIEIQGALNNLLGEVKWATFTGSRSVAIAINDKTRPVPHNLLLPPLLDKLASLGIQDEAITFYVAVGTHPPMKAEEFPAILPPKILNRHRVVSHDGTDSNALIHLGKTRLGTPVWINAHYQHADLKIVVGNIEPHQFVGFSGGVKSAAIGLAGLETINHNHALMTQPASQPGEYDTNPARQDVEEIGQFIGIHLALNAILNTEKQVVRVLAGDPVAVMQQGVPLSRQICQMPVMQKYTLVIASPGGHPKDINLYQAQKGLAHAARVTRTGGTIILIAACTEGTGSQHYEDWMVGKKTYQQVIHQFQAEGFRIGPHKAFQIARDALKIHLMTYSELEERLAQTLLLNPINDVQSAVDMALADLGPGERIGFLPYATTTIPYLDSTRGVF